MSTASQTPTRMSLDTSIALATPERIEFRYPLAGPFRRVRAYLIDQAVIALLVLLLFWISAAALGGAQAAVGVTLAGILFIVWGYGILCEGVFNGRTIGKRAMGLRVVSDTGLPITGTQAVIRNLVGTADGLTPFFTLMHVTSMLWPLLGLASIASTRKFQRLGDLAAGTMVIVEEARRQGRLASPDEPDIRQVLVRMPARVAAGGELARAISDYVQARPQFSLDGRRVLAEPLARVLIRANHLPEDSSPDAVLCAAYHRIYLGEQAHAGR